MTWFEANDYCIRVGAKLVEINSEEENTAIVKEINRRGYMERLMFFWIGLTDADQEGTWKLESNGLEATFLNWDTSTGEPNNHGNENCAHIRTGGCRDWDHSGWNDVDCNIKKLTISCTNEPDKPNVVFSMNALCELEKEHVSAPGE